MTVFSLGMSSTDNLLQLLGLVVLFIVILVITYYTTKLIGGIKAGQQKKGNIKVLETFQVTQNKYLQLVQVGKKYIVIAIGKNEIQLITELKENELNEPEECLKQDIKFLDLLSKITKKQEDKNTKEGQETDRDKG